MSPSKQEKKQVVLLNKNKQPFNVGEIVGSSSPQNGNPFASTVLQVYFFLVFFHLFILLFPFILPLDHSH